MPPAPPAPHVEFSKLTKAERHDFEDRRRDYLLALYGTEAQKRRLATLLHDAPPYAIFRDMEETAPAPPVATPVVSQLLSSNSDALDTAETESIISSEEASEDDDLDYESDALSSAGDPDTFPEDPLPSEGPSASLPPAPTRKSKPAPAAALQTPQIQVVEQTIVIDDDGGVPAIVPLDAQQQQQQQQLINIDAGMSLVQATAVPIRPPPQRPGAEFVDTAALGGRANPRIGARILPGGEGSYDALPPASFLLWWAALLALVLIVGYEFAQSRCWRRRSKLSGLALHEP